MATQKQDERQGDGGGGKGQQAITVQRGQGERQLSRDRVPTARRLARTRPFSTMRRMLDDLGDIGTWTSPFGGISPFSTMRRMFDSMERMFDTDLLGDVDVLSPRDVVWAPRIEITQREDKLLVRTDLPGVPQDKIQISAEGNSLVIEGERPLPSDQQEDVWCSECARGQFRRVVALPEGAEPDKAEARYENGVLEVSIPVPATQTRGRRIEIQTGAKQEGHLQSGAKQEAPPNPPLKEGTTQQQHAQKH